MNKKYMSSEEIIEFIEKEIEEIREIMREDKLGREEYYALGMQRNELRYILGNIKRGGK